MRRFGQASLIMLAIVTMATPLRGQSQACRLYFDRAPRFNHIEVRGSGFVRQFFGGGVIAHCIGTTTRMVADSIAYFEDRELVEFIGSVRFSDSSATLEADRAVYRLNSEQLEATGHARLENLRNGTVLTGPTLIYYRRVPGTRDTTELYATQRPTIHYRSGTDSVGAEPYVIVGNHVRLKGESLAWAGGTVTIDRSDFHADGDSTVLDMGGGDGIIVGHAHVRGGDSTSFALNGRDIAFRFTGNDLNWVQARGTADARSVDFGLVADTIEFSLSEQRIQSGFAWGDSTRPEAVTSVHTITADSLAFDSPGQILEEIRGFGAARASSVRDSVDTGADWISGDTVTAHFDSLPGGRRILSAIQGRGNAHAFYRIFKEDSEGPPEINYSRGLRIIARMDASGVERVDVVGKADGVHLEPIRKP